MAGEILSARQAAAGEHLCAGAAGSGGLCINFFPAGCQSDAAEAFSSGHLWSRSTEKHKIFQG
jgi:hypothetical protein